MDLAWNMVSNRSSVFLCLINVCQHYRRTTLSLSSSHHLDSRQKADWVRVEDINNYKQWKTCFFINWIWPHSLRWGHGLSLFVCVHVHMFCSRLLGSSQTARHQCGLWIEEIFLLIDVKAVTLVFVVLHKIHLQPTKFVWTHTPLASFPFVFVMSSPLLQRRSGFEHLSLYTDSKIPFFFC